MSYLIPWLLVTEPEKIGEPFYFSDLLVVITWTFSFFAISHVWAAFISPYWGPNRSINVLFLRTWFPGVARAVDNYVKNTLYVTSIKTRAKLGVSFWRIAAYSILVSVSVYMLITEGWFSLNNLRFCVWGDVASNPPPESAWPPLASPTGRFYYLIRMGYTLYSLLSLVFYDNKRSDYMMYVVHHTAEILLLLFSFTCRLTRFGMVVLLIHDPSDLFLQMAKAAEYTSRHPNRQKYKHLVTVFFTLFAVCWLILRLILLPVLFSGIWTDVVEPMNVLVMPISRISNIKLFIRLVFTVLAGALYVLHWWWFVMIIKIVITMFTKNKLRDSRSDDEHDPEVQKIMAELEKAEKEQAEKEQKNKEQQQNGTKTE